MAQSSVIQAFHKAATDFGATPRERKALFEAGIVESGLRNLNYGDRDSLGALQQRPSQGWHHATDPYTAALDFLHAARSSRGVQGSAGALAQAVQRSAFPARYDQVAGQASSLLGRTGGTTGRGGMVTQTTSTPPSTDVSPGDIGALVNLLSQTQAPSQVQMGAIQAPAFSALGYVPSGGQQLAPSTVPQPQGPSTQDVLRGLSGLLGTSTTTPGSTSTVTATTGASSSRGRVRGGRSGVAMFDGKPVAAWIAPILAYVRQRGWKGTVTSGYRSDAEQKRIYDSGVRPAALPRAYGGAGSNHERTGFLQGAVDVSDAATLSAILQRKHSRLKWAGGKDPVHFSVPRNGSY